MSDPVLQTTPLGFQWATVDPFLFCVHHLDLYPEANEHFGPDASLEARDIGMDFAGTDGSGTITHRELRDRRQAIRETMAQRRRSRRSR